MVRKTLYVDTAKEGVIDLKTSKYSRAAHLITELYMGNIPIGPALFKNILKFKNVIKTEEDQKEYIANMAVSILETYPIMKTNTRREINNHSRNFVIYSITNKLEQALSLHIENLSNTY
jgi:hypothetical protein